MEATSDALLVTAARGGDGAAYGELFARYQSRIYSYAYGIAGNRDDAADIAQEAFVRVFEALPRLEGELNFSAYVYRATHNIAIDTVKGRSRFEAPEALEMQVEPSLRADPERVALVQEQQHQAWQAAFQLTDDHRSILTLRELHDLSYQEIADIMDMPRNTVGVLLSRARLRFKEAFRMSSVDIDKLTAECEDMLPLLSAYLDDELDEKKRARVESHLEQCAFCRLALEEMTESSRSYRALLPLLPPAALGEGLWHRLGDIATSTQPGPSGQPTSPVEPTQPAELAQSGQSGTVGAATSAAEAADSSGETAGPTAAMAKAGHRFLRPKLAALMAGGAAVIVLGTLAATGTLGGRGGSGADDALALDIAAGSLTSVVSTTTTTAPPTPGTTTMTTLLATTEPPTTLGTVTEPPTTVAPTTETTTPRANSAVTGSTTETTDPNAGSDEPDPDSSSSSVTEAPDTAPPPTPGIIYPAVGELVKGLNVTLRWEPVKDRSGVTYRVEVQSLDRKAGAYVTTQSVEGIKGTEFKHVMNSTIERWRVTAIDGAGNVGKPSAWAKFAQATASVPSTKLTITTTTTVILY